MKKGFLLVLFGSTLLFGLPLTGWSQTKVTFASAIHGIAQEIQTNLKNDPRIMGQRLSLGEFVGEGPKASNSNSGLEMKRLFSEILGKDLDQESELTLSGSYHFLRSSNNENRGLEVLRIVIVIKRVGKEILPYEREVNFSDDIFRVLGLTGTLPPGKDHQNPPLKERNEFVKQAATNPSFDMQEGHRVAAKGVPAWSVGLLKKSRFDGSTQPVSIQNVKGFAFGEIKVGEFYEIEVSNQDERDTVASICVDGLDVANTFSVDKNPDGTRIHWPGFFVPARGRITVRGWLHSIDPKIKDNVFSFAVKELGQGAATAMKTRGSVGVITVQFREACSPDRKLSGRTFGETAKGEGLQERLETKQVIIGENVLSTVSIRYNRPE